MQSPINIKCLSITPHPTLLLYSTLSPRTISCSSVRGGKQRYPKPNANKKGKLGKGNGNAKGNVWSVDNEKAWEVEEKEREKDKKMKMKKLKRGKTGKRVGHKLGDSDSDGVVLFSGAFLMELETVLQTQEPVIRPLWRTFVSSVSGIWKGVGAVFSPITAEMEPIDLGKKKEYLYDCYILNRVQAEQSEEKAPEIHRKVNWITRNPHGERRNENGASGSEGQVLPKLESLNFENSDVMEEDTMDMEPGLVVFEDGSYSRGAVEVPVGEVEVDETNYFITPMFKFEQCLVKGCHKRLRIVHTLEFSDGDIQILRVAVYEEQWVGPVNVDEQSEVELDIRPFSERKRVRPSELEGSWKVFEVSATPVYGDDTASEESNGPPYVYLCMETINKRSLPENPSHFREEEMLDMQDVTVLWLPGGVTAYVDVSKDGVLCIGVGWYSDEGINLVMERDYEMDGKLREVRYKSEVKRRWSEPLPT